MNFAKRISAFTVLAATITILASGCGNPDGSVSLSRSQKTQLVQMLGTYEGQAQPQEEMGAMMTGVWKARFYEDTNGELKCQVILRLHDSQYGWDNPSTSTATVKIFNGSGDGLYDLKAEASFSEDEPNWLIVANGISLNSTSPIDSITLFDMNSNQITLSRD